MSSGTRNSIGDFLRSVFSALVNKDDEIFKALFANQEETGVIETIFNELETIRNEWCNNSDVYNQIGEMLEKTFSYFSVLDRLFEESDKSYKDRNALLFYRNGNTLWGDKWDVLNIFQTYFGTKQVFIVNDTNSIQENILLDGDFEEKNAWILEGCAYHSSARFSERLGVYFNSPGTCRQTVSVDSESTYFIHFFLNGNIGVEIKDNNNRYYDAALGEFGDWAKNSVVNNFSASDWDAKRVFFLTDTLVSSVTISFIGEAEGIARLDYVRLFKKGNWSSFTIIANFTGIYTAETLAMSPGKDDPVRRRDYSIYGHFSNGRNDDREPINPDNLSFIGNTALNENQSPHMADKDADTDADIKPSNDMYLDETAQLAHGEGDDDDSVDVNYEVMSYIEQANLFGTDTVRPESVYTELLDIVRAGGITSYIEIITRDSED
jgi:hypothetical protein